RPRGRAPGGARARSPRRSRPRRPLTMRGTWDEPSDSGGVGFAAPSVTRVVKLLLIANVAVFVLQFVLLDGWFPNAFLFFRDTFALTPGQWKASFPLVPVWQLVTYGFLHGGPTHVL